MYLVKRGGNGKLFEKIGEKGFLNREHTGEYVEVEFDTYITNHGKEEIIDIVTPIHYFEAGEGEPLIMVHGIGQNAYTWRKNFEELSKSFHVYAIDLPGHGYSGKPEISYSIEEFALAIEAFLNVKKIVSAYFCAFGEGAVYVLDFAIHNAERAKGIVLVSPVISEGNGLMKGRNTLSVFGNMATRMKSNAQVIRNVLEDCYFDRTLVTDEVVGEYWNGIADKDFKMIARMSMMNFLDDNVVVNLGAVKCPLLVIVGTDDKIAGGRRSLFMDLGFTRGNVLEVRNCGYLVHEEKAEKTNDAIKTFFKVK